MRARACEKQRGKEEKFVENSAKSLETLPAPDGFYGDKKKNRYFKLLILAIDEMNRIFEIQAATLGIFFPGLFGASEAHYL